MSFKIALLFVFCPMAFSALAQGKSGDVDVAVTARDIARGSVIAERDLIYQAVPAQRAASNVLRSIADAAGKEARRALRAGELIRATDVKRPTLVAKGSTVTMVFDAPGMRLTAVGRALTEGGEGESITVLNPTSYRQVDATVIAAGTVRVGALNANAGAIPGMAAAQP